jgi:hypothetical protein
MVRRWLSSLFGKKKSQPNRHARRAQLSVEVLEGRELMSANPALVLRGGLYRNGSFVRDASTGAIDIIQNGKRSWLSLGAYESLGSPAYTNLSDAAFKALPAGPNYTIPNGAYLRDGSTGAIDIIENGQKCWLSPAVYAFLGSPHYTNISHAAFGSLPSGRDYVVYYLQQNSLYQVGQTMPLASNVASFTVTGGQINLVVQAGGFGQTLGQFASIRTATSNLLSAKYQDPNTGATFNLQQGNIAPDGYSIWDIRQGWTADCVFCSAMASAVSQGVNLGSRIEYLGGTQYQVIFQGEPIQRVTFDGTLYHADIRPRLDSNGNLENLWAIILERAYLQAHGVDWTTPNFPHLLSSWASPKVAEYDLIGGVKNNWNVGNVVILPGLINSGADSNAQQKMAAALQAGNLVTVGCNDSAVMPGLSWKSGHEFAVLGMRTVGGQIMVTLYNPWGVAIAPRLQGGPHGPHGPDHAMYYQGTTIDGQTYDAEGLFQMSWSEFSKHFGTFTTCGQDV